MTDSASAARWAVVGAGGIARRFVSQLPASGGELVAVGSESRERAEALVAFAAEHGTTGARPATHSEALSADDVDAVYVATVHTGHARLVLDALAAGKAVLCEKPMTPDLATTTELVRAARSAGGTLVEAFMYRFHPQTRALLDLVREGAVGEAVHVEASFAFRTPDRTGRLYDPRVAGGGILDVGGYPVSMVRAIAGAVRGAAFAEPRSMTSSGAIGPTGVDEWAVAELDFGEGLTASVRCGIALEDRNAVVVTGSRGRIVVRDPWTLETTQSIEVLVAGEPARETRFDGVQPYAREAAATIRAITEGEPIEQTLDDSLGTARVLETWRAAVGVTSPS